MNVQNRICSKFLKEVPLVLQRGAEQRRSRRAGRHQAAQQLGGRHAFAPGVFPGATRMRKTEGSPLSENLQGRQIIKHRTTIVFIGKAQEAGQACNRVILVQGSAFRGRDAKTES